jgi:hypothetical protein
VQILLEHTEIESTVRYLGVDVEDALTRGQPFKFIGRCLKTQRRRSKGLPHSIPDNSPAGGGKPGTLRPTANEHSTRITGLGLIR